MSGCGPFWKGFPFLMGKKKDALLAKGFRALDKAPVVPDDCNDFFPCLAITARHRIGWHVEDRKAVSLGLRLRFQNTPDADIISIPSVDGIIRRIRVSPAVGGAFFNLGFGQRNGFPINDFQAMAVRRLEIEGVKGKGKFGLEIGIETQVIVNDDCFAVHEREDKILVHIFS